MSQTTLSISPQEAAKLLVKNLPSRRMRDVVEKRFGLKGGRRMTLEAIGKEYKITRERVRQIEADAFRHLAKGETLPELKPTFEELEQHVKNRGGVMAERDLFPSLVESRLYPHVAFLLKVGSMFRDLPDTGEHHARWAVNQAVVPQVEKMVANVVQDLDEKKTPVSGEELLRLAQDQARVIFEKTLEPPVLQAYLGISKRIKKNPYGEYGLTGWSAVTPRGVRDKAYVALVKIGQPLHFQEVAKAINKAGWSKKKAHPQTVHNELIKDHRFVLVGRGLYALREWGYEPGIVRDVLVSVLRAAGKPMSREEIVRLVAEKRFVKPQTILLNLQNRNLFRRADDGKFTLV